MKIFAHRGASGDAPQNTISAIKIAVEQECDGIEIDLQLTKDNEVVIYHDWNIETLTNKQGEIKDFTLNELKKLDFGGYFSDKFKGEKIPTLDEVLDIVPENMILNLELKIKSYNESPLVEKTIEILKRRKRTKNILVSSFDHEKLRKFKTLLPDIETGLLYVGALINPIKYIAICQMDVDTFNLNVDYVSKDIVKDLQRINKRVYLWTVNKVDDAQKFNEMGVDGIMTNYPYSIKQELELSYDA